MQTHNKSFLLDYKSFLRILFLFGMCSYTINKRTGRAECSRSAAIWTIVHLCFILSISLSAIAFHAYISFKNPSVIGIANFLQFVTSLIVGFSFGTQFSDDMIRPTFSIVLLKWTNSYGPGYIQSNTLIKMDIFDITYGNHCCLPQYLLVLCCSVIQIHHQN